MPVAGWFDFGRRHRRPVGGRGSPRSATRGQPKLALAATTSLARLLRDTNRRDEARAMLADIYNWFTEGFDTADLKDAKSLLDEMSN